MRKRVMVLCLDAFDAALSDRLITDGRLAGLARLKGESACFTLEHGAGGKARYTGLTWEHFSSGRKPETTGKWSVISFDPKTYRVRQNFATERPFLADVDANCVVFDVPYFDLVAMPQAIGVVGWGGHDTGVRLQAVPDSLMSEINARFGPPPDVNALNVMVYPNVAATEKLAKTLRASVKRRADIAEWLLKERAPDWDVALVGFGETHDAIELFYHGIDSSHHLSAMPSAAPARQGLIGVYEEISAQIERLIARFPDATVVAFTMHGMGQNDTDLPTMLLLPELLYRMAFDRPLFVAREDWRGAEAPTLKAGEDWNAAVTAAMHHARPIPLKSGSSGALRRGRHVAVKTVQHVLGRSLAHDLARRLGQARDKHIDVDWMPASHYARYWSDMDAFAVPSFFEGQVRVNLQGREKNGRVPIAHYAETLDQIEHALRACVDTKTGEPVVREIFRPGANDPMSVSDTQGDLAILWNGSPVGFRHPVYGQIGPGPVRRVGGHSGGYGALYLRSRRIRAGEYGLRSSFDVAPTILELMGQRSRGRVDGESLVSLAAAPVAASAQPKLRALACDDDAVTA